MRLKRHILTCEFPKTPVIYVLPKVHKSLTNVPGRPILSRIGSLTEHLSNFIDDNIYLATFDVTSLYTNVPYSMGLQALKFFLNKRVNKTPSDLLVEMVQLVLSKNYFRFQDNFFSKTSRYSFGSNFCP